MSIQLHAGPRLRELEAVIAKEQAAFIRVGAALAEIQTGKLYKDRGYTTFAGYVADHLGWSRRRAYDLIEAHGVRQSLTVQTPHTEQPTTVVQHTELAKAGMDAPEVWQKVVAEHGPTATASQVREQVVEHIDPPSAAGFAETFTSCPTCGGTGRLLSTIGGNS